MHVKIYAGAASCWLLVPDFLQPSREASANHGPLAFVGRAAWSRLTRAQQEQIQMEFDRQSFALVPHSLAAAMLWPQRSGNDATMGAAPCTSAISDATGARPRREE